MLTYTTIQTEWGHAAVVCSDRGLCGLLLPETSRATVLQRVRKRWPEAVHDPSVAPRLQRQIQDYFAGKPVAFDCPIDLDGLTPFHRSVLNACHRIGYGEVTTYGELARRIGKPSAARAIGGAMARNPIPLVVPCHRIIAGNGSLCGFSAPRGIPLKRRMLDLEAAAVENGKAQRREGRKIA